MDITPERLNFINSILGQLRGQIATQELLLLEKFAKQYYLGVDIKALAAKPLADTCNSLLSHWKYIQQHAPLKDKPAIRVHNPNFEQHGWHSSHTIIDISSIDMPFVIDSIMMVLAKFGITIHTFFYMHEIK